MALNVKGLGEGFVSGFGLADDYYARKGAAELATRRQTAAEKESGQLADYRSATLEQQREAAAAADARGKAELGLREQANADEAEYRRGSLENDRLRTKADVAARNAQAAQARGAASEVDKREARDQWAYTARLLYENTEKQKRGEPGLSEEQQTSLMAVMEQAARRVGRPEMSPSFLATNDVQGAAGRLNQAIALGKPIDAADISVLIPSLATARAGRPNADGKVIESEQIRNLGAARLQTSETGVQFYEIPVLQRLRGGETSVDTIRVGAAKDEKSGIQLTFSDLAGRANSTNYLASLVTSNPAYREAIGVSDLSKTGIVAAHQRYEQSMVRANQAREENGNPALPIDSIQQYARDRGVRLEDFPDPGKGDSDGTRFDEVSERFPTANTEQLKKLYRIFQRPSGAVPAPGRMLTDALSQYGLDSLASKPDHVLALTNEASKRAAARLAGRNTTSEEKAAVYAREVDAIVGTVAQRTRDRAASRPVTPARPVTPPPR